jgi:signal transduction histidine kinase
MKHRQRRLPKPLGHPSEEPAAANQPRQKTVVGRKPAAGASANHEKTPRKSLEDSLKLQEQLRRLTHRVLVAQEDQRIKLSHELRDEIAQTLLGINVRLLLLKQAARSKARGLENEIASTQRLVVESAAFVRRLARDLDDHQPTPSELRVLAI